METKIGRSMQEHPSTPAVTAPDSARVPPPSTRRPRVREVSSRFMSPVSSSSSSSSSAGDLHHLTSNSPRFHNNQNHQHQNQRSISAQRSRRQLKMADGDENRSSETTRSLDSPFPLMQGGKTSKQTQSKPLKENGHRVDTPTQILPPPSRSRLNQQRLLTASAATRLLHLSGISLSASTDSQDSNKDKSNGSDLLPTISNRNHPKVFNNSIVSPLHRSLTSPLPSCDDSSVFRDIRGNERASVNGGVGLSLPPVAPNSKIQTDTRKQKKVSGQQAEVHTLKLLHNRYLQWRFANAKAEIKAQSQKSQAESMFYSLGVTMAEMSDSVKRKRIELQNILRLKAVMEIVESQTPALEQWSVLEEEYSSSLSETTESLLNASLRLPLSADVKVETKELIEAFTAASKSMENIAQTIGNFMPKAQKMETLLSEVARVSSRERASVEDCGIALLKTQSSHIEECYLRSQLIQHKKTIELRENTTMT